MYLDQKKNGKSKTFKIIDDISDISDFDQKKILY